MYILTQNIDGGGVSEFRFKGCILDETSMFLLSGIIGTMASLNPHIFRAYDIRGKAHQDITPEICVLVGRAFGSILRERYRIDHPSVVVGWDARTHSPAFAQALIGGLTSAGCTVLVMGETPSPVNYFTICRRHLDGGVQITASHNPAEDNGLKLQTRDAEAFSGEELQVLRRRIEGENFLDGEGTSEEIDAVTPYLDHLSRLLPDAAKGLSVVVDNGNGVTGPAYNKALKNAGADVTELFAEPDGEFPNHIADPSRHASLTWLREEVVRIGAHVGLAFDGDGDRVGVVDDTGEIRSPDEILLLLAEDLLSRHPGAAVVFTVSNSSMLETEVARLKGVPVMCKVGHSFVEHAMRENNALLGGEQSGHFFCAEEYFGFDDALVAALRILDVVQKAGQPLSEVLSRFPRVFQAEERRPHCADDAKFDVVRRITEHFAALYPVNTLDGARIDFGEGAWAGIRASNTSPKLSICIEARTADKLKAVEDEVLSHMRSYPEICWE